MSMNSAVLSGNVTKDPEIRAVGENKVARFSLAVNRPYKKDNNYVTDFFDVEFWGNRAEYVSTHVTKGAPVTVHGRVEIDTSEKDGVTRRYVKLRGDEIEVHTRRSQNGEAAPAPASAPVAEKAPAPVAVEPSSAEEDLPF